MLKRFFPDKQFLVRQNGAVKYFTLPTWAQVTLFIIALGICVIAAASGYQNVKLHSVIDKQAKVIENKQIELDALHLSYREKHTELTNRIAQIDEKSQLMTNMIDSLPEAEQAEFEKQTTTDKTPQPVESETLSTETITNSDTKPAQVEQTPEMLPEQKAPEAQKSVAEDDKTEPQQQSALLDLLIDSQNQHLNDQFDTLTHIVEQRTASLLKAIDESGFDYSFLSQQPNNTLAQGGPFNAVNTTILTDQQRTLLDNIVTLNELSNHLQQLPVKLPVKDFYISSRYGLRTDPFTKRRAMHRGIDMAGWHKTKIFAPASGKVVRAGTNGGFGKFIEIEHNNGFVTRYGHLATIKVKRGDMVLKDQIIGLMGSSGRSTSTHLHYEILHNNKHVNPLKLSKAFENVF